VTAFSFDDIVEDATVYEESTLTDAGSGGNVTGGGVMPNATTVDFAGGNVTMSPTSGSGWDVEVLALTPGDTSVDLGTGVGVADNWPIPWEADTLYMVQMEVSAPDALGESSPIDILQLGFDVPTTELIYLNGINRGVSTMKDVGMPKQTSTVGGTQTYTNLFYSHSVTLSTVNNLDGIRPRVLGINSGALTWDGDADNLGGFTIHSWSVKKVHFQ
jgi:hypothetical protein